MVEGAAPGGRVTAAQIGSRGFPGHYGGVERVIEAVAPRLVQMGYDIVVYAAGWSPHREPTYRGVRLVRVAGPRRKYLDTVWRSFVATLRELFGRSDILHFHSSGSAPFAVLARLAGKRVVTTIHGIDSQRRKWRWFVRLYLRFGEWMSVKVSHRVIVVGESLREEMKRLYGADVTFIPNGVDLRTPRAAEAIKRHGLGHRDYVLYLARLVPEKQCHTLIQAWQALAERRGLKLVIAGPTWYSKPYVDGLREMAAADPSILFTGEVSEEVLEELYSNCHSYVLPSEVEGRSLSLLDALAFGACTLTSDVKANADVVGDAGIVFKVCDVADLREKLQGVIDDGEKAEEMRRRAAAHIRADYSWDEVARRWGEVYASVAPRPVYAGAATGATPPSG